MNYYSFHIGDFNNATRHLTRVERSLYRDLIDHYYDTEQPLPAGDIHKLARRICCEPDHVPALESVLNEFFCLQGDLYTNARCDEEIAAYRGKIATAVKAGKASAERRSNARSTTVADPFNQPRTKNQEPRTKKEEKVADRSPDGSAPPPPEFDGLNSEVLNGKTIVPLSARWELPEEWGVDAVALGFPTRDVLNEAEKFRQYWTSGKGAGKRRAVKGWRQSWSNWLGKAAERR